MPTPLEVFFQNLDGELEKAIQHFWISRQKAIDKKKKAGSVDTGSRGAVTAGDNMRELELLILRALKLVGLPDVKIVIGKSEDSSSTGKLEIPGYFRPEKKWDILILSSGQLIAALELKSQVGPSFGNNANNRTEEALGSAADFWTAYREKRFGSGPKPFLGYIFLLEECPEVHKPVKYKKPHFAVDPIFVKGNKGSSYAHRYEVLCERLVLENLYSAACLIRATKVSPTVLSHPADTNLTFRWLLAALVKHAETMVLAQGIQPKLEEQGGQMKLTLA